MTDPAAWLAATSLSRFLGGNAYAFPVLEILHVLSFSLVLGTVFIFDLRLLGWSWRQWPVQRLLGALLPFTVWGFALAAVTGTLLFLSQPESYLRAFPFLLKLALLAAAGINVALFHLWIGRGMASWPGDGAIPLAARLSGLVSLLLWIAILVAGRFIGFLLVG